MGTDQSNFDSQTDHSNEPRFRIGDFTSIPDPTFIPEIKGPEGLHAVLDHRDILELENPLMVPAARWSWMRAKREIINRTGDALSDNEVSGEIKDIETNHPILFFEPPELYNFCRTAALANYFLKNPEWNREKFHKHLARGEHREALHEIPQFHHPFLHANPNRLFEEVEGAATVSESSLKINSTDAAWTALEPQHYAGYYHRLTNDASVVRSAAMIPPVPRLTDEWNDELVRAMNDSNAEMCRIARSKGIDSFYHVYLDYRALDPSQGRDPAGNVLRVLDRDLRDGDFAGIALTVNRPHQIWQQNRAARLDTFAKRFVSIARENDVPAICPRSEWFGAYLTDHGFQAFSSLLNGRNQYPRYSRDGGPTGADTYGKTMIPGLARSVPLQSETELDLESYLKERGGLPEIDGLPSTPPDYDPEGRSLEEIWGTGPRFRKTFAKPRRLAHIEEAREFREKRATGVRRPAQEYLSESENPYVLV